MDTKRDEMQKEPKEGSTYLLYEASMSRMERQIKRLWIALIITVIAIAVTNIGWLIYISQYDYESYEVSADNDGVANYIGNDGDIYNGGESFSQEEKAQKPSTS